MVFEVIHWNKNKKTASWCSAMEIYFWWWGCFCLFVCLSVLNSFEWQKKSCRHPSFKTVENKTLEAFFMKHFAEMIVQFKVFTNDWWCQMIIFTVCYLCIYLIMHLLTHTLSCNQLKQSFRNVQETVQCVRVFCLLHLLMLIYDIYLNFCLYKSNILPVWCVK